MTTLVAICIMILSFVYVMFHVAILRKSKKMHAREKELLANGVIPYGSGLCHSMVVEEGGIIAADSAFGGTSVTVNTVSADGIIFK